MWTKFQENIPKNMQFSQVRMNFRQNYGSHLVWYGLRLGKNCREYCNKQALICNRLRAVSKMEGDTGTFKKI